MFEHLMELLKSNRVDRLDFDMLHGRGHISYISFTSLVALRGSLYSKKELLDSLKPVSKWSKRFMWAAAAHGFIATVLGLLLAIALVASPSLSAVEIATIIRIPGAGFVELAALFAFFAMYVVVGVLGTGVSSLFYHHVEVVMGKMYSGEAETLAWIHLVLMNVGIAGATWTMIYAGYLGGVELWSTSQGGLGWSVEQVVEQVVTLFVPIVGLMLILTAIGVLAGGIGFIITYRKK
jgi:hypothetical protein